MSEEPRKLYPHATGPTVPVKEPKPFRLSEPKIKRGETPSSFKRRQGVFRKRLSAAIRLAEDYKVLMERGVVGHCAVCGILCEANGKPHESTTPCNLCDCPFETSAEQDRTTDAALSALGGAVMDAAA